MDEPKQKKPKKKVRHTKLVLPQEHVEEPSLRKHRHGGRIERVQPKPAKNTSTKVDDDTADLSNGVQGTMPPAAKEEVASAKSRAQNAAKAAKSKKMAAEPLAEDLPENTILMPKKNPRLLEVRRKKRRRRLFTFALVVLAVVGVWLYASGNYLYVVLGVSESVDSVLVALMPGDEYPIEYSVPGYITSEGMGSGGFASLGESDLVLFSAAGNELQRIQHGFANPGLSTGDTRACVYSRGGKGYLVEGRSDTLLSRTTDEDILFVEMSDNGSLLVVTSSRYRSSVQVFSPTYQAEPNFSWDLLDEKPVDGAFAPNNKDFALACLSSNGGALGTTIYLLHSGEDEEQAVIRAEDASILTMQYLSQNSLLVVYDQYTAVYNSRGEETDRYDYAGRNLLTADVDAGRVALVFGSEGREDFDIVLLRDSMSPIFEVSSSGKGHARVLSVSEGVLVLVGQHVEAFNLNGELDRRNEYVEKPLDLVQAREPLLLTVTSAESLQDMFEPVPAGEEAQEDASAA